jgi:hypothetical protein
MRLFHRLIAIALCLIVSGPALAAMDPAKVATAREAADEFLALAEGSRTAGQMPRQTDPKVKALLDRIFDRTVLGREVLPIAESAKVGELINNANRIGFAYMLAGTGLTDPDAIENDPKAAEVAEQNVVTYAPELGRWFDYQMALQGAIADSMVAFLASAKKDVLERPQVKSGLGHVRQGLAGSIAGMFQTMSDDALDDAWRRDRMAYLNELAPKAAKLLPPDDAKTLQEQAGALADAVSDPELKAALKGFGETIVKAR